MEPLLSTEEARLRDLQDAGEPVLFDRRDAVAVVTLNRPEKLNAFNEAMHAALRRILDGIAADAGIRAVLLTGAGRGFCSGQDLAARKREPGAPPPDLGAGLDAWYNPLVRSLRALEKPVVAAVNGVAAGAGANLALACDIVLAARSARFVQAFARIGLVPDCGGTWLLPRLVGSGRAAALIMLGEAVGAEEAARWGMIWRVVDDAELMPEAERLAAHLARQPTRALALMKRALDASWRNALDAQLDLERDLQREAGMSEDYREGVAAFLEKRPANFSGR
jgi:2-(1,2-epoxy-1,2-dihydrophenyl)acetyl-CoA isomerase